MLWRRQPAVADTFPGFTPQPPPTKRLGTTSYPALNWPNKEDGTTPRPNCRHRKTKQMVAYFLKPLSWRRDRASSLLAQKRSKAANLALLGEHSVRTAGLPGRDKTACEPQNPPGPGEYADELRAPLPPFIAPHSIDRLLPKTCWTSPRHGYSIRRLGRANEALWTASCWFSLGSDPSFFSTALLFLPRQHLAGDRAGFISRRLADETLYNLATSGIDGFWLRCGGPKSLGASRHSERLIGLEALRHRSG